MSRKSVISYLPEDLQSDPLVRDIVTSFDEFTVLPIEDFYSRLLKIRDPYEVDSELLVAFRSRSGLDIDSSDMTSTENRRFVTELISFYELSGTRFFIDFLSYVIGVSMEVVPLYSEDYVFFIDTPGTFIENGGTWYPTPHVNLTYHVRDAPNIDEEKITRLFYKLAPITLVLKEIIGIDEPLKLNGYWLTGSENRQVDYVMASI